ncbi:hypothetical protein IFM47457_05777 [Aspergillus lentulus]|nr:hypothetical protein IFM47457_05777 [Aspergillus lentulus]
MDLGPYLACDGVNYECRHHDINGVKGVCRSSFQLKQRTRIFKSPADIMSCNVYGDSVEQLQEHNVAQHHLCVKYSDYFANKNNLEMVVHRLVLKHQQKHQPQNLECYGCYQNFKSFSGMLIHLESGSCILDTTKEDIDDIAHDCYQSQKYIDDDLEHGRWLYRCPSCEIRFPKLSVLY